MRRLVLLLAAIACGKDPVGTDPGTPTPPVTVPTLPEPTEPTEPLPACAAPLAITPASLSLGPLDLVTFSGAGGTGQHRWALAEPAAGTIHETIGAYLAPETSGATDTVVLTDLGCRGEATAAVTVGDPFAVLPLIATVLPGTAFDFEVTGGSGEVACALVANGSGATLGAPCAYTAGPGAGRDRVEIADVRTGDRVEATITVDPDATFVVDGYESWMLPVGATFVPRTVGGSGALELVVSSGPFTSLGGSVRSDGPGAGSVVVRDRFAGFERTVAVEGLAPFVPPSTWYGQRSLQGRAVGPGDLNGDGYDDAILGLLELNGDAWYSGGVAVWSGGPGGLGAEPVWVAPGTSSEEYSGRSVVTADLDQDGLLDLLVGADGGDSTSANIGLVRIWRGVPGGFFEDQPWVILRGVYGSDRFGSALAACDFDGDGWTDVAVGAYGHEDRAPEAYPTDTGAVMVFRGGPGGLPDDPSVIRYGVHVEGAGFASATGHNLGLLGMDAGDLDGDGDCELAVAVYGDGVYGATDGYGYVLVWEGMPSAEGTLSAEPVRSYANTTDTNANFGRELAIGDLDGDGLGDLAIGAYGWDGVAGGSAGGVFVYRGASDDGRPATEPHGPEEADWWVTGGQSSDYTGLGVSWADVDGDGQDDLVVGEPRGDLPYGVGNAGRVRVWAGADLAAAPFGHDGAADPPLMDVGGAVGEDYFGQAVAALGDADGDGLPDLLVLAGRTDVGGYDLPAIYGAYGDGRVEPLVLPNEPAGSDHGRAVLAVDADGDGVDDLLVGSPQDADPTLSTFVGAVSVFDGLGGGSFAAVGAELGGAHADLGSSDRFGFALARTDFDGDGFVDLAVAARTDSRPTTFGATYTNPADCPGSVSSAGSVAIFRGSASGTATTPAFVYYGFDSSANVRALAGDLDFDGDGYGDLVVGGRDWSVEGGVAIVHGRPADPAGTVVICDDEEWIGGVSGDWFGQSVAAIPDLDGDGCDEVAAGAPFEDGPFSNQGVVRVLWGHGASCSPGPRVTALAPGLANAQAGQGLASGGDVDGDGLADLVVGATDWRVGTTELGIVWVVPGSWLRSLPAAMVPLEDLPDALNSVLEPMVPPDGHWGVEGLTGSARFGQSVALVPDPDRPSRRLVAIGAPDGDEGGVAFAGGVRLHRFLDDWGDGFPGLDPVPFAVVGGETHLPGGQLGETLWAGRVQGQSTLLIGAPLSSQGGLRQGAGYVVPLR